MAILAEISKILTPNDTGETGGHQSGILVPKQEEILAFFPTLAADVKNPRAALTFHDDVDDRIWKLSLIYYNNRLFGGTRNEYRLTGLTGYFNSHNLKAGDVLVLSIDDERLRHIAFRRKNAVIQTEDKLKLGGTWKTIRF